MTKKRKKYVYHDLEFNNRDEEMEYLKHENEYLKKIVLMGETENSIENLWSSKNLK
jgi:hypothetical protein